MDYSRKNYFFTKKIDFYELWKGVQGERAWIHSDNPDVAAAFLKEMKRNNVTQIRGYSKEPERLLKGKKGKFNELKSR